jgi:hypothetical protein
LFRRIYSHPINYHQLPLITIDYHQLLSLLLGRLADFLLVVGRLRTAIAFETVGVDLVELIFFAACLCHNFLSL